MHIQINTSDPEAGSRDEQTVLDAVSKNLGRFEQRLTRVEVHLKDSNGPRVSNDDKVCTIEARPAGLQPFSVTETAAEITQAVNGAATKLARLLDEEFTKRRGY